MDVYDAMLGLGVGDEGETIASIRRGLADLEADRTRDLDEVFADLDAEVEPWRSPFDSGN
jgi:hypothetical protein